MILNLKQTTVWHAIHRLNTDLKQQIPQTLSFPYLPEGGLSSLRLDETIFQPLKFSGYSSEPSENRLVLHVPRNQFEAGDQGPSRSGSAET